MSEGRLGCVLTVWDRGLLSPALPAAQTEDLAFAGVIFHCGNTESWNGRGWKGPSRSSPARDRDAFHCPRLLRTPSKPALDVLSRLLGRFDRQEAK